MQQWRDTRFLSFDKQFFLWQIWISKSIALDWAIQGGSLTNPNPCSLMSLLRGEVTHPCSTYLIVPHNTSEHLRVPHNTSQYITVPHSSPHVPATCGGDTPLYVRQALPVFPSHLASSDKQATSPHTLSWAANIQFQTFLSERLWVTKDRRSKHKYHQIKIEQRQPCS